MNSFKQRGPTQSDHPKNLHVPSISVTGSQKRHQLTAAQPARQQPGQRPGRAEITITHSHPGTSTALMFPNGVDISHGCCLVTKSCLTLLQPHGL